MPVMPRFTFRPPRYEVINQGSVINHDYSRPKVSVIACAYNQNEEVGYLIESVIAQVVPFGIEVIIVDDCSTDETVRTVARYPDVTLLQLPKNAGNGYRPKNAGIAHARGEQLLIIDSDNYLLDTAAIAITSRALDSRPEAIGAHMNVIFQLETEVHGTPNEWMNDPRFVDTAYHPHKKGFDTRNDSCNPRYSRRVVQNLTPWDLMVRAYPLGRLLRASAVRKLGGFPDVPLGQVADSGFFARVGLAAYIEPRKMMIPVNVDGYAYRVHGENHSIRFDSTDSPGHVFVRELLKDAGVTWDEICAGNYEQIQRGMRPIISSRHLNEKDFQVPEIDGHTISNL